LLTIFFLVTLTPATLLFVFGYQMLRQDRELQLRQSAVRQEQLADLAVANIRQSLDGIALHLENPDSISAASDSAVIEVSPGSVRGSLLFYPFTIVGEEAFDLVFAEGEQLELHGNPKQAAEWYARMVNSEDPALRAGALIRQGRALYNAGEPTSVWLPVLDRVAEIRGVGIRSVPADLFARWMACLLLSAEQRQSRAVDLHSDLISGKWQLDRVTFEMHETDTAEWSGGHVPRPAVRELAIADAAAWIWTQRREVRGQQAATFRDRQMTLIWRTDDSRLIMLIAGPDYVSEHWLARLPGVQLLDAGTRLTPPARSNQVRRYASETGLPWTIVMPEDRNASTGAAGLWLAGVGLLVVLVIVGACFLARAAAREYKVSRLQADFVAAVSHEFRTPLTTLQQFSEVLEDGRVSSEERRQTYYKAIARQTERLHQLVESLLDFGRMEAGRAPYQLAPLDARIWLMSVVEQFQRENAALGIQVDLAWNGTAATIAADPPALTNALRNLLENAVKYSPGCRTIWVSSKRDSKYLAVCVRDCGLGIPPEEQRDIFGKFVRGTYAKQLNIQGTGIGLAMVAHIIKAHGGEVKLESQPGVGSTFTILLPCYES
jgi:signal transduction histidine kinase